MLITIRLRAVDVAVARRVARRSRARYQHVIRDWVAECAGRSPAKKREITVRELASRAATAGAQVEFHMVKRRRRRG